MSPENVWEVLSISAAVQLQLTSSRVNDCTTATRLLVAASGYAMAHGILTMRGARVTKMFKMVANVVAGPTAQATRKGHWWVRYRVERDGGLSDVDLDLTACQFFGYLSQEFSGDPRLPPLKASMKGLEIGSQQSCGAFAEKPEEYSDAKCVLQTFCAIEGLEAKMLRIYERLCMPHDNTEV